MSRTRRGHAAQHPVLTELPLIFGRTFTCLATCAALAVHACPQPASAQVQPGFPGRPAPSQPLSAEQITRVSFQADRPSVAAGETFFLAVIFESRAPWHIYWKNPGEGAAAPDLDLTLPDGFTAGEIRWPRPTLKPTAVGDTFILEGRTALLVPVTAPADLPAETGRLTFQVNATWAVCDADMCLFGRSRHTLTLVSALEPTEHREPEIARFLERLPKRDDDARDARIELKGETLHMTVPAHGQTTATFFPLRSPGVEYGTPRLEQRDDRIHVSVSLRIRPRNFLDGPPLVGGLVALGDTRDLPGYEMEMRLRDDASPDTHHR